MKFFSIATSLVLASAAVITAGFNPAPESSVSPNTPLKLSFQNRGWFEIAILNQSAESQEIVSALALQGRRPLAWSEFFSLAQFSQVADLIESKDLILLGPSTLNNKYDGKAFVLSSGSGTKFGLISVREFHLSLDKTPWDRVWSAETSIFAVVSKHTP